MLENTVWDGTLGSIVACLKRDFDYTPFCAVHQSVSRFDAIPLQEVST